MEIFESDIGDAFLVQDFLDKCFPCTRFFGQIGIENQSQSQFASESVEEVMENFTVTFDRAEKNNTNGSAFSCFCGKEISVIFR